jgi:hypothetical protein
MLDEFRRFKQPMDVGRCLSSLPVVRQRRPARPAREVHDMRHFQHAHRNRGYRARPFPPWSGAVNFVALPKMESVTLATVFLPQLAAYD